MPTPQNVGIINFANVITHFHDLTLYYKKFSPKTLTLKNERLKYPNIEKAGKYKKAVSPNTKLSLIRKGEKGKCRLSTKPRAA